MDIADYIKPGSILYLKAEFPHEDEAHRRYLVVVTCEKRALLLKINTSNHQSEISKRKKEYLFKIRREIYTFLEYDSYLDCGSLHGGIVTRDEILKQLKEDKTIFKGVLIPDHKNEVIKYSQKSKSLSPFEKRTIKDNFSNQ